MKTALTTTLTLSMYWSLISCGKPTAIEEALCHDQIDNDEDGQTDCLDADCILSGACDGDSGDTPTVEYCSPCMADSDG